MGADAAGFFSQIGLALVILREKAGLTAHGLAGRAGEEASAFLKVLESLLELHRAVIKAQVSPMTKGS